MKKFVKLYESALTRFTRGGYLAGDLIKFIDNALKDKWFDTQPDEVKAKVKELLASDLNIRVANIKPKYPAGSMGAGNTDYTGSDFFLDVAQEIAPGKWVNFVTVPASLVTRVDTYPNLTPIPGSLKYDNKVQIKPTEVKAEENEEEFFKPYAKTRRAYVGKKLEKTDSELQNKNIKIPAVTPKNAKDPAVGTARYLPKEKK